MKGLTLGADDYLAKPFKTAELVARINAVCRRPALVEQEMMSFHDLSYDPANRTLNNVALTDKEAEIMKMFLVNPKLTVTKQQILAHVWGADSEHDENYVEVYMSYLRKKLKEIGSRVQIKTIRGLGYKLDV